MFIHTLFLILYSNFLTLLQVVYVTNARPIDPQWFCAITMRVYRVALTGKNIIWIHTKNFYRSSPIRQCGGLFCDCFWTKTNLLNFGIIINLILLFRWEMLTCECYEVNRWDGHAHSIKWNKCFTALPHELIQSTDQCPSKNKAAIVIEQTSLSNKTVWVYCLSRLKF